MNIIIFDIMSLTRGRHCSGHRRWDIFTARCDASAVFTVFTMQCLSNVYLSVCLSKGVPFRRIPTGTPLTGASNATGYYKNDDFFTNISLYLRNGNDARGLASIELSFHPCNILRDSRRGVSRENKNVGCGT